MHLSFSWQFEKEKFFLWQQFIKLLYYHLKDIEDLEEFYFDLLEEAAKKLKKQNPKRVFIEAYIKLLEFEGRLHDDFRCFICEKKITNNPIIKRGYLLAHKECINGKEIEQKKLSLLFETRSTIFLDDIEIKTLWEILEEGM